MIVAYPDDVMDDLLSRFERPDARNRWDSPLFEIHDVTDEAATSELLVALRDGILHRGGDYVDHAGRKTRDLVQSPATHNPGLSETNLLHDLSRVCQDVIVEVQRQQGEGGGVGMGMGMGMGGGGERVPDDGVGRGWRWRWRWRWRWG